MSEKSSMRKCLVNLTKETLLLSSQVNHVLCQKIHLIGHLGRSPREGNGNTLSILPWRTPWTEEPGRPQGCQESDMTEQLKDFTFTLVNRGLPGSL